MSSSSTRNSAKLNPPPAPSVGHVSADKALQSSSSSNKPSSKRSKDPDPPVVNKAQAGLSTGLSR